MQEDHAVEWLTVGLLAGAVAVRLPAVRRRRWGDALVALVCLVFAGEEVSWGQRLVGYMPPELFLERNAQQELTLHNFAILFGQPKYLLAGVLLLYGVVLPLMVKPGRMEPGRVLPGRMQPGSSEPDADALPRRAGDTPGITHPGSTHPGLISPPPIALAPWWALSAVLLLWYPVDFTGEWVEALAASLFVVSAPGGRGGRGRVLVHALALPFAAVMAFVSARRTADPAQVACARVEVQALLADLERPGVATNRLARTERLHVRVWTAGQEGYLGLAAARTFAAAECVGMDASGWAPRRRYAVDPWGTAYWLEVEPLEPPGRGERRVTVYSFGPNRRRDGASGAGRRGDDVAAAGTFVMLPGGAAR